MLVGTAADGSLVAFPGLGDGSVPTALTHACFHNLRVSGAFLVSGCFKENATQFVSVTSEAGRPGRVELPSMRPPFAALPASAMGKAAGRAVELKLGPGDPDSFTRFRPYLAHFLPVFPRFVRVFTV